MAAAADEDDVSFLSAMSFGCCHRDISFMLWLGLELW